MKVYYLYDGKQQAGPYSIEELKEKSVNKDTLVWTDQLNDWTKAGEIEELNPLFTGAETIANIKIPPPPPKPQATKPSPNKGLKQPAIIGILALVIIAAAFFILRPKTSATPKINNITTIAAAAPITDTIEIAPVDSITPSIPTEKEPVKAVIKKEKFNPAKYIEKTIKIRKNFVGQTIIEGSIRNLSTTGVYKDVVLNIEYLSKTGSTISTQKFTVYEVAKPNKRIPFKFKTRAPYGTFTLASEVIDATPVN